MKFYGAGVLRYPGSSRTVHDFEDGSFETLNPEIIRHALAMGYATEPPRPVKASTAPMATEPDIEKPDIESESQEVEGDESGTSIPEAEPGIEAADEGDEPTRASECSTPKAEPEKRRPGRPRKEANK